ncbi:MAG: tetratricopeptide repeat protein [Paracoccaceae bacterium]
MRMLRATLFAAALLVGGEAAAQSFEEGLAAYDRGDYGAALEQWMPLAKQGEAAAQHNLGSMYDRGEGVPQDHAEAVRWWRLAAEQGHVKAQFNLGVMHATGEGVSQDPAEAVR